MAAKSKECAPDEYFEHVLDVCLAAIQTGEEIPKHQVRRSLEFLEEQGEKSKAADLKKLLDVAAGNICASPNRLVRSRASLEG